MAQVLIRVVVLLALAATAWLAVTAGRRYVESRRRAALRATPLSAHELSASKESGGAAPVRILAFSSADCTQCHRMQAPALDRLQDARPGAVSVQEIDAPSSPALAQRYHVLTVPTTVVLDAAGRAHAVNYGFAPSGKLLAQVDAVLAQQPTPPAANIVPQA